MSSRAVLLPAIGDPVLSKLWLRQYEMHLKDYVDTLYVVLNSGINEGVMDYTQSLFEEAGVIVARHAQMTSHGAALKELFDDSAEQNLLLLEDDCFVLDGEMVDRLFRGLEKDEFDLAGSPRMSCSPELADIAAEKWDLKYHGLGDKGCSFWPNCFFVKRKDLLKTDLNFDSTAFPEGTELFGHVLKEEAGGDTMVWLSLQLRNLGLRIREIPQYHCQTDDMGDYYSREGIFDGYAPWIHTGSSSSLQGLLDPKAVFKVNTVPEAMEIERRLSWWAVAYEMFKDELPDTVKKHCDEQHSNLLTLIRIGGLSQTRMNGLIRAYRGLVQ